MSVDRRSFIKALAAIGILPSASTAPLAGVVPQFLPAPPVVETETSPSINSFAAMYRDEYIRAFEARASNLRTMIGVEAE